MTELIDTASPQAGINFKRVAAAGRKAAIVKAGGANILPLYEAPHYREQLDGARAAGLAVGHYWLVGRGDIDTHMDHFAAILRKLGPRDLLMIDNERLDANATFWTDDELHQAAVRLHQRTGVDYPRIIAYIGLADYRAHTWTRTPALGVRRAVAVYGPNDGLRHATDLGGPWPAVIHQYTSVGPRWGGAQTVDLDWSPLPVAKLFPTNVKKPAPAPVPAPAPAPAPPSAPDGVETLEQLFQEDDLPIIARTDANVDCYLIEGTSKLKIDPPQLQLFQAAGAKVIHVTDAQLAAFKTVAAA